MVDDNSEEYIKQRVLSEIEAITIPTGLKDEMWKSIKPKKRRYKPVNVFPFIAMVACMAIIIPLSLNLLSQSQGKSHSGFPNGNQLTIMDKSKAVLIPDGNGGKVLTLAAFIQNHTDKETEPFYVDFDIKDEWLRSKLNHNKFTFGEGLESPTTKGKLVTVKPNSTYMTGATCKIEGPIDEKKLKKTIEENNAIKVSLVKKDKEILASNFITNFGSDLTPNGVDDTSKPTKGETNQTVTESKPPVRNDGKWVQLGGRLYYTQGTVKSIEENKSGRIVLRLVVEKTFPNAGGVDKPYNIGETYSFFIKDLPNIDLTNKKVIIYGGQLTSNDQDNFMGAMIVYYQSNDKFVDMNGKEVSLPPKGYPYQF